MRLVSFFAAGVGFRPGPQGLPRGLDLCLVLIVGAAPPDLRTADHSDALVPASRREQLQRLRLGGVMGGLRPGYRGVGLSL